MRCPRRLSLRPRSRSVWNRVVSVVAIVTRERVDDAWEAYREHVVRSFDDRHLLLDRGYMERWALLEAKFKRLALMPRTY